MGDQKEKLMITVPYDDFVCGIEALRIIISARQMLRDKIEYASPGIKAILGISEDGDKNAGKN